MAEADVKTEGAEGGATLIEGAADGGKAPDPAVADAGKAADGAGAGKAPEGAADGGAAPDAAAAAAKDDGKTLIEGAEDQPKPFPDDWKEKMAAGDDKAAKLLARYKSPEGVVKALMEANKKIAAGIKPAEPFPDKGTPEEQAAWREQAGIPSDAKGYHDHLDGIVIGEEDQPLVDEFLASAHAANQSPEAVKTAVDWYFKTQERIAAERVKADQEFRRHSAAALKDEMGGDMSRNLMDLKAWLGTGPAGEEGDVPFNNLLFGARLADGSLLGDNPRVLSFLTTQMRLHKSHATVTGAGEESRAGNIDARIAEIEKFMATNRKEYHADKTMKAEYRDLLDLRAKRTGGQADKKGEQAA